MTMQSDIFDNKPVRYVAPFKTQLLKWIGSKQRFAHEIIPYFPQNIGRYFEPFLGSGAVLGTFAYHPSVGSDIFKPLAEIWQTLRNDPNCLKQWYRERWQITWKIKNRDMKKSGTLIIPSRMRRICCFCADRATAELSDSEAVTDICQPRAAFISPYQPTVCSPGNKRTNHVEKMFSDTSRKNGFDYSEQYALYSLFFGADVNVLHNFL